MFILKFFSLFYSIVYFAFRGMLSLFLARITGNNDIVSIAFIISIFNVIYAISQTINGKMIEKFGFKYISIICLLGIVVFNFFYIANLSFFQTLILTGLLSFCMSSATIVITIIANSFFPKITNIMIGLLRMILVLISGFFIAYFTGILDIKLSWVIFFCQVLLLIASISIFFLEKIKKENKDQNIRERDWVFWGLCLSGTFSSLAYFFFQAGYLQVLYAEEHKSLLTYLSNGFGLGNLFVICSFFIDFRKIATFLNVLKLLSLINIIFFGKYLEFTYLLIGVAYGNHILPLGFIAKQYKMPVFHLSLYNSVIMLLSSFGFLTVFSYVLKKIGLTQINILLFCKFFGILTIVNIVFYVFWFIKEKRA